MLLYYDISSFHTCFTAALSQGWEKSLSLHCWGRARLYFQSGKSSKGETTFSSGLPGDEARLQFGLVNLVKESLGSDQRPPHRAQRSECKPRTLHIITGRTKNQSRCWMAELSTKTHFQNTLANHRCCLRGSNPSLPPSTEMIAHSQAAVSLIVNVILLTSFSARSPHNH